jgi:hypothetical protein
VLRDFHRVLVPGGRVAVTVWDKPQHARLIGVLLDAIADAGAAPPGGIPPGPPFFQFSTDEALAGLLDRGGFVDIDIDRVTFDFRVDDAEEWWHGLLAGTVRSAALITGQPPAVRQGIRAAFDRRTQPYAHAGHLRIPVSVKVASGRV